MPIGIVILVFDLILWIILILKSSVKKRARIGTLLLATILLCVITFIVFQSVDGYNDLSFPICLSIYTLVSIALLYKANIHNKNRIISITCLLVIIFGIVVAIKMYDTSTVEKCTGTCIKIDDDEEQSDTAISIIYFLFAIYSPASKIYLLLNNKDYLKS